MKKAVLLVVPGTSCREAALVLDGIGARIAQRFGDTASALAYSSNGVRAKLAKEGRAVDSPAQALCRLRAEGITHVVIKPLHMVAGMEYAELQESVTQIQSSGNAFPRVRVDRPLLESQAEAARLINALLDAIPEQTDLPEALVLVAHGSRRDGADQAMEAANAFCRQLDRQVFMGAMISRPDCSDVIGFCTQGRIQHVQLAPFMIVAGYSARHEIGGDEAGSWKNALQEAGVACTPVLKGLAEYDAIVHLWLERIDQMLTEMESAAPAVWPVQ